MRRLRLGVNRSDQGRWIGLKCKSLAAKCLHVGHTVTPGVAAPAKQTSASVALEQAGSPPRLQHLLQLLRQQPLALLLRVLKVRKRRDGRFHRARTARRLAH